MSQNITLMGASYSAVPAVDLPKTGGGTARFTDVTDTTAAASDVASGKYFYTSAGVRTAGTGTGGGGGGSVTQDANGFIVLPDTGGGGGGGSGFEYEEGIWTPNTDTSDALITFAEPHTDPPFYYIVADQDNTLIDVGRTAIAFTYMNFAQIFGYGVQVGTTTYYGFYNHAYTDNATPPTSGTGTLGYIWTPYTDPSSSAVSQSQYWATSSRIRAYNSRTFRAGRSYKWLAIWTQS